MQIEPNSLDVNKIFQFGVICHGDLWWSNILFKYGDSAQGEAGSSGIPTEVKFIDFQSARLASLVTDLLSFAFTSMSSAVRRNNIYDLLEVINHRLVYVICFKIKMNQTGVDRDKPRNLEFGLWTLDFFYELRMTQGYQLDHSLSKRLLKHFFDNVLLEHVGLAVHLFFVLSR